MRRCRHAARPDAERAALRSAARRMIIRYSKQYAQACKKR
ncbi:conserved hypothetical protein [Burkholderia mallei PRL-20]|uniref:Uncharacterized protein n=1 Tax=Burkholderia mallei (strain NCTC 10229) TaxID=412022 RepID=A2S3G4_BURM9|nr:hypothetical protein BMASAVP1_A1392 [Burkholderia mallei SAVP1]ABN01635.1 hypothetical protein BMA10229_A0484 [Burkholderia mallei NCTC 10229]ABO06505.1 hypothetical protein BMA10247_0674 [Burkholderia mallei NCTC 10247]EDK85890.1 hypothetical protein BMA721280_A0225 [Burkholderia mallei 2002721280]EDP88951.1 hypothetical protein BMA10399_E0467 [Burkholderia mallei ATCC 10399]EEP86447.1 conserved hypothetical protein [Burkholderia mallei GB8 horse 4]EES44570.1 conserved hypothetical protei